MHPSDTFQIIDFADKASTFAPRPLANTPENRDKAHRYLGALVSSGGTNQLAGIHAALSSPGDEALHDVAFTGLRRSESRSRSPVSRSSSCDAVVRAR